MNSPSSRTCWDTEINPWEYAVHTRENVITQQGIARGHRGNPTAGLMLERIYGMPVLLSGVGALVLSQVEINVLDIHHKSILRKLLRLPNKTPSPCVYFLSVSLPAAALLHMHQHKLLGLIFRQQNSVLYRHALDILSSSKPSAQL